MLTEGTKIIVICGRAKFLNVMQGLYYSVQYIILLVYLAAAMVAVALSFVLFCVFWGQVCFPGLCDKTSHIAFQNKFKPNPTVNKKVQKNRQYTKYAHIKPVHSGYFPAPLLSSENVL